MGTRWIHVLHALTALCLLAGAGGARASAVEPLRVGDGAAPTFSVYTSRDGLGDEIWSTVGVDRDGFVWAGSASTLARFDGYRWTLHPLPQARGLVRDMATDADGTLWAIFEREGLARFDGQHWTLPDRPRFFQRFSTTRDAGRTTLWAMSEYSMTRLQDGVWRDDPENSTVSVGRAVALGRTDTLLGLPRQWLGTSSRGLWFRDAAGRNAWKRFEHPAFDNVLVTDLLRTEDDGVESLWVLTYGAGLMRVRDDGVRVWRAERGELPSEALYSAVETRARDGESLVWIASRAGLLRVRGERIDVFDRRHGLPSEAVRGVKVQHVPDGNDLLWLATEAGMARAALTDSPWRTVSLIGARENGAFGVLVEPDGSGGERLWVGSAKEGLRMLSGGQWQEFSVANGRLPNGSVRGLWRVPGPDGRMHRLLGLMGAGLHEIDDDLRVVPRDTPWPVHPENAASTVIARTVDGQVEWWVGTLRSGVYRWRDGAWTGFTLSDSGAAWGVLGLAEHVDAQGRSWLWAAGPGGMARYDGRSWEPLPDALALPQDGARAITPFTDRSPPQLWVSTNRNGVVRLDVTDPLQPRLLDDRNVPPAPDPTVYSVLRDSVGRVYVCTNNGVQQLTETESGRYVERVFRRRDGLVHDECNTNAQQVDAHDRYWVGTLAGLSMFDPRTQADTDATTQPRPLHITAVVVDGLERTLPADGAAVAIPPRATDVRVDFTLLSGVRETESIYRTELVGDGAGPSPWSADHSRRFAGLPPGTHVLRIEARDYAGTASAPRVLEFSVEPAWWQRTSLQILAAALVLLAAIGAVMTYNRGLRARQRQLLGEVAARTAELRAANASLTELSYLDPLTGVANRRRLMEAMGAAIERAAAQRLPIGLIVADVDHFKAYNDHHGHLAGDVALRAVAHALQTAVREHDLVARFGGEEFACLVIDADRDSVLRIAERMRALVEALPPRSLGNERDGVTLSAGVVHRVPHAGERPEHLLHAADAALYAAKNAGRNRVVQAGPQVPAVFPVDAGRR